MHSDMARQTRACGTGRTYSSAFTLLVVGVQVEASHPVLLLRWWRLGDQVHCLAFPTVVTLLYFSVEWPQEWLLLLDKKVLQSCQFWISRPRLQPQTSLGPGTNFAYLAESDLQLAFDEYNWRQSSVPVNPHTPLRTIQQAQDANVRSSCDIGRGIKESAAWSHFMLYTCRQQHVLYTTLKLGLQWLAGWIMNVPLRIKW